MCLCLCLYFFLQISKAEEEKKKRKKKARVPEASIHKLANQTNPCLFYPLRFKFSSGFSYEYLSYLARFDDDDGLKRGGSCSGNLFVKEEGSQ